MLWEWPLSVQASSLWSGMTLTNWQQVQTPGDLIYP